MCLKRTSLIIILLIAQTAFSVETVWTDVTGTHLWDSIYPNIDGEQINLVDFAIFAKDWIRSGQDLAGDINGNGTVNIFDLGILTDYWLGNVSSNWSNGLPSPAKDVTCNIPVGPTINSGMTATANKLRIGNTASCTMTMTGGIFNTTAFLMLGANAGSNGILNMSGGTINIPGTYELYIGYGGNGNLTLTGGIINVGDYLIVGTTNGSVGHLQLDGGKVYANNFSMRYDPGAIGTMNITQGELIVTGNMVSTVNAYISNGWITAYDGNTATSKVYVGYDSSTDKTHVWADKNVGTVSIYTYLPTSGSAYYRFWKNSGFTQIEFLEIGWNMKPSLHSGYYSDRRNRIDAAKAEGFKVAVIILACMNQWTGPADYGNPGSFTPDNAASMAERLAYIQSAVTALNNADRFIFFAGDPGVTSNANTTINDCMAMAQDVRDIVQANAPNAEYTVNIWAIPEWGNYPPLSAWNVNYWKQQVNLAQIMQTNTSLYIADTSVQLTCDNYYRTLALDCYVDAGQTPELYPTASDITTLRGRAVKDIWAWAHFLIDEADDGYTAGQTSGQTQLEVRYIRDMVNKAKNLRLDGITSNMGLEVEEALNAYAFGRFCTTEGKTSEQIIDEIAGLLATPATKATMANILKFVENNSTWHLSMPVAYRLPDLNTGNITSAAIAISELDNNVVASSNNVLPLPATPANFKSRIRTRLIWIRDH